MGLNRTHEVGAKSWVESANVAGCEFPVQNLPFGVFSADAGGGRRVGVAIGDKVLDVAGAAAAGLFAGAAESAAWTCGSRRLNELMANGPKEWSALRLGIFELLEAGCSRRDEVAKFLVDAKSVTMHLPCAIGDYTDFYASIHHATNVGLLFRPDNPLLPNYKHLPIGYHGRVSSIVVSGTDVRRPVGQIKPNPEGPPVFEPTRRLDYELELGFWMGGEQELGETVPIEEAEGRLFGVSLLNDWSARDVQAWEYQPLGPFLSKNFATTISPWVVTMEALEPFRVRGPVRGADDPPLLPYLRSDENEARGGIDVALEVFLQGERISRSYFRDMYWTAAQMVAHHTCGGCNLQAGDLLGSGTVSGPADENRGCLLELSRGGREPLTLKSGEKRTFLLDGDTVKFRARCERDGAVGIGFGECVGKILKADRR